jgi:hypothetical protein
MERDEAQHQPREAAAGERQRRQDAQHAVCHGRTPSPSREVRVERPEEHIHHGPERRTLLPEERLELLAIASPPLGWVEAQ